MKRKIFTLLVAFLALAAFHANAAGGTGQSAPHFLKTWSSRFDVTGNTNATIYPYSLATAPGAWDGVSQTDFLGATVQQIDPSVDPAYRRDGYITLNAAGEFYYKHDWLATNQEGPGPKFGNFRDYFTIDEVDGQDNSGTIGVGRYRISAYQAPGCSDAGKNTLTLEDPAGIQRSEFEIVRFKYDINKLRWDQVITTTPENGGYLSVKNSTQPFNPGRLVVVRVMVESNPGTGIFDVNTGKLELVSADKILSEITSGSPTFEQDRKQYLPVWIQSVGISGRWAQVKDFTEFPDFIEILNVSEEAGCNLLGVEDGENASQKYSKFKVAFTGRYQAHWSADASKINGGQNAGTSGSFDFTESTGLTLPLGQTSPSRGPEALFIDQQSKDTFIQLFSFVSPEDASKLVTVTNEKNVFGTQWQTSLGAFGNRLVLETAVDTTGTTATLPGAGNYLATPADTLRMKLNTQRFAIWIEADGTMSLYPVGSFTYAYGEEVNAPSTVYKENYSLLFNAPVISAGLNVSNRRDWANNAFRIGKVNATYGSEFVVGPTEYDTDNVYIEDAYRFLFNDITEYNQIPEKRYFYLESKTLGRDGKPMVLDVVKTAASTLTDIVYKVVLTDREVTRFNGDNTGAITRPYFDIPFDSLNMSACWSVKYIYNTDVDNTIPANLKDTIGYVFKNEEGVVLAYDFNAASWNAIPPTEFPAYLQQNYAGITPAGTVGAEVWKTLSFKGDNSGYFFMKNIGGFNGLDLIDDAYPVDRKYLVGTQPFAMNIDTANYGPSDYVSDVYYSSLNSNDVNRRYTYYDNLSASWNGNYGYGYLFDQGKDGVLQRDLAAYESVSVTAGSDGNGSSEDPAGTITHPGFFYNIYNSAFGMELKLAEIHVNRDENLAPHDSILNGDYLWENYAVDSLWIYLNKTPGQYFIKEALGWVDVMDVQEGNVVGMGLPTDSEIFSIERVDPTVVEKLVLGSAERNVEDADQSYKWYYIKQGDKYLEYAAVRQYLTDNHRYGFKVSGDDKANAAMFRFYQPIVGDKEREYFIIQTYVPEYTYDDAYAATATTFDDRGEVKYAVLRKDSKEIGIVDDPRLATRWDFILQEEASSCRFDYIDNEYLVDTKMYGAPLTAERVKNAEYATGKGNGRFITEGNVNGSIESPDEATRVYFTLVPAEKIEYTGSVPDNTPTANDNYGAIDGYNYGIGYSQFELGNETRGVQLYYVRRIVSSESGADTTYMTVTGNNFYKQSFEQKDPSVSGDLIKFLPFEEYSNVGGYTNDSTLLQMFAVYGELGLPGDRDPLDETRCIYPLDPESFGLFVFIPAAAYTYDYSADKPLRLDRNVKIGNSDYTDEFRVGARANGIDLLDEQLMVVPALVNSNSQGEPASEYIFKYEMYKGDFSCINFIQGARNNYITSYAADATYAKDYADPSSQWRVERSADADQDDHYTYAMNVVAPQKRNQEEVGETMLTDDYYLYLIYNGQTEYQKADGEFGYSRIFSAVRKIEKDPVDLVYNFGTFDEDVNYLKITEITNQYPGDLRDQARFDATSRKYKGDSAIDYFFKFTGDETFEASWKIVESILADRYTWSRDYQSPQSGELEPFVKDITPDNPADFLQIRRSWTDTIAKCGDLLIHSIPYYTIIYTAPTGEDYYLMAEADGTITFRILSTGEKNTMINNPGALPQYNFCFPYRLKDPHTIIYQDDNKDSGDMFWTQVVFIQSQIHNANNPKPVIVKIEGNSGTLTGTVMDNLYDLDYIAPAVQDLDEMNVTSWFFGSKRTSDDVWIRMNNIPEQPIANGWLRSTENDPGYDYFVTPTNVPANGIAYGELVSRTAMANVDDAKLVFAFRDSAILGNYDPKRIWYYNIIKVENGDSLYLTSAGGTADRDLIWAEEGYAYFTEKKASDPNYTQLFGLKWIKAEEGAKDPFYFWVVAGVNPGKENTTDSPFYYLAQNNSRLVFRYGGGTSQQDTEETAMRFEVGQTTSDIFTGIDEPGNDAVAIYGVEGAVMIQNGQGKVELYTMDGRLIKSEIVSEAVQTIQAPRGMIIVKNADKVAKVVVK